MAKIAMNKFQTHTEMMIEQWKAKRPLFMMGDDNSQMEQACEALISVVGRHLTKFQKALEESLQEALQK